MLDLEAIELIKQLKARYFRSIDTCDIATLRDQVFTADASAHFRSPSYDIKFQGFAAMEEFYRKSFTPGKFGMHQGHHPEIEVSGDTATGVWYLHDIFVNVDEKTVFEGSALYDDKYVKTGKGWRIASTAYDRLLEMISPLRDDVKIMARPTRKLG